MQRRKRTELEPRRPPPARDADVARMDSGRERKPEFGPVAIQFAEDSKAYSDEMGAQLDAVARDLLDALRRDPDLQVWLAAVPEDDREDRRPARLSVNRVQVVHRELVRRGVPNGVIAARREKIDAPESARHQRPHVYVGMRVRLLRPSQAGT